MESKPSDNCPNIITPLSSFSFEKGKIYYIIIFGIASSGKLTFFNYIQQLPKKKENIKTLYNISYISSKDIHNDLAKEYQKQNPNISQEEAFEKVAKDAPKMFEKRIFDFKQKKKNDKINVILINKSYPQGIDKFIKTFIDDKSENIILCILPNINKEIKIGSLYYPFSINYVIQCFLRLKKKKRLDGSNMKSYYSFFSSLRLYQSFNILQKLMFNMKNMKDNIFVKYISFTDEKENIDYENDNSIKNFLANVLKNMNFDPAKMEFFYKNDISNFVGHITEKFGDDNHFQNTIETVQKEVDDLLAKVKA